MTPATAEALGLAWGFGWRVAGGVVLGYFLDEWLGTEPLFLAVLAFLAFGSGIADFLRIAARRRKEGEAGENGG